MFLSIKNTNLETAVFEMTCVYKLTCTQHRPIDAWAFRWPVGTGHVSLEKCVVQYWLPTAATTTEKMCIVTAGASAVHLKKAPRSLDKSICAAPLLSAAVFLSHLKVLCFAWVTADLVMSCFYGRLPMPFFLMPVFSTQLLVRCVSLIWSCASTLCFKPLSTKDLLRCRPFVMSINFAHTLS